MNEWRGQNTYEKRMENEGENKGRLMNAIRTLSDNNQNACLQAYTLLLPIV